MPFQETPFCPCRAVRVARQTIRPVLEGALAASRRWHRHQHQLRNGYRTLPGPTVEVLPAAGPVDEAVLNEQLDDLRTALWNRFPEALAYVRERMHADQGGSNVSP